METRIIETPKGHKIEVKTYLTGRDVRRLQLLTLKDKEVKVGEEPTAQNTFTAENLFLIQDELLNVFVVSVNGNQEKCVDTILDFDNEETDFITKEITSLWEEWINKKKSLNTNTNPS